MPTQFGRYEVTGKIGGGGMGVVLRARDPKLNRLVAVKVVWSHLRHEPTVAERFRREATALARLSHPSVVRVFDAGVEGEEFLYYVMELLEGISLETRTCRDGDDPAKTPQPFNKKEFLDIFTPIADALAVIHEAGLIHRDVKPANIIAGIPERGAVLTDFGLAWMAGGAQLTQQGLIVGTGRYMAPEQVRGEPAGPLCDVYALGATMWEHVTCRVPFEELKGAALLPARLAAVLPDLRTRVPGLPGPISEVVARCVQLDPKDRFAGAREVHRALAAAGRPAPIPRATPGGPVTGPLSLRTLAQQVPAPLPVRPPRPWLALAALGFFALALVVGLSAGRRGHPALPVAAGVTDTAQPMPIATWVADATRAATPTAAETRAVTHAPRPGYPERFELAPPSSFGGEVALSAGAGRILALHVASKTRLSAWLSTNGGSTWERPGLDERLPERIGPELALALQGERFYLLFVTREGPDAPSLYCVSTTLDCREWSSPVRIGQAQDFTTRPVLAYGRAGGQERFLALWSGPSPHRLQASWSDRTGAWTPPADLGAGPRLKSYAAFVANNEGIIAWQEEGREVRFLSDVFLARTPGPGVPWSGPANLRLEQTGLDKGFFFGVTESPYIHLQWSERPLALGRPLFIVSSADGGRTWTRPRCISAHGDEARRNALAVRGDRLWSVWESLDAGGFQWSASTDRGRTWTRPRALSTPGRRARVPALVACDPGSVWALLSEEGSALSVIRLK